MSSVPGAPVPLDGPPSPPSNPWTTFGTIGGAVAIVAGLILMLVGASNQNYYGASPLPYLLGTSMLVLGALLFTCAFVLAGIDWYLKHPRPTQTREPTLGQAHTRSER